MTPNIVIHTCEHPEDNAMLQALYSRSADSVTEHLKRLAQVGSGKFMQQYYVGYGHNSIADCGYITIYLEGISMLAAKAIEDNPLYNGQESSSRYIDWSGQPFFNPYVNCGDEEVIEQAEILLDTMRKFYVESQETLKAYLKSQFPAKEGEDSVKYEKAVSAKAFDILRGYLPCGAVTNVAWTTSLRKAREHLTMLSYHPLIEVSNLARRVYGELVNKYPNSFPTMKEKLDIDVVSYNSSYFNFYFNRPEEDKNLSDLYYICDVETPDVEIVQGLFDKNDPDTYRIEKRPARANFHRHSIPVKLRRYNVISEIDFGSFRDLQRHRNGYCGMPLVDNSYGFHQWYYDQLPQELKVKADALIGDIAKFIHLTLSSGYLGTESLRIREYRVKLMNQYILPMGTIVPTVLSYDMPQMAYVLELRTGQTVHPTLRRYMQEVFEAIDAQTVDQMSSGSGTGFFPNLSPDEFTLRRGSQDIVAKEQLHV